MSAPGFTPISLYHSTTAAAAPSAGNLANGELAVNITDGKLFYKDNGGVVRVLATAAGSAGDVVGPGSSTDNALVRFDGTTGKLVQNSVGVLDDSGALSGLTSVAATTFTGALTGNASTATTLQTSRTIWGQSFDGSANVTGALTGVTDLTASGSLTLSGGTANGVAYLNGSKVLTSGSALTFDGTTFTSGAHTLSAGNLNFGTTGQRITGDFSNATQANRVALQTSTVNGSTSVTCLPNGTGLQGAFNAFNNSDPTNAAFMQIRANATETTLVSGVTGTGTNLPMVFNVNASERMRIDTSGNVGIGTNSPVGRLHVNSATESAVRITSDLTGTTSTDGLFFGINVNGTDATLWNFENGYLRFATNSTEQMRIDSSGNLLVGTTAVASNVSGVEIRPTVAGNAHPRIELNKTFSGAATLLSFQHSKTEVGRITSDNTTTSYVTSSDYRLKESIAPMTGALAKVAALKPVTYKWKVDGSDGQGFIAHELQAVCPHAVVGEKDAVDAEGKPVYQGIDTSFLVATLTAAIQEQQAIIEQLKADVAALKAAA